MRDDPHGPERPWPFQFLTDTSLRRGAGSEGPVLIGAFEGWNDAGEAASFAADRLGAAFSATPFAEIDPEEFFDFTEVRPQVNIVEGRLRSLSWPTTRFSLAAGDPPVVIATGPEPQLRWRAYTEAFAELARRMRTTRCVLLGAYLADVTHRGRVELSASGSLPEHDETTLAPSYYEGPTGILGVLQEALEGVGIPAASVWAGVPCYSVSVATKAALALAEQATRLCKRPAALGALARQAVEYEQLLDELIERDENVAAFVERIESGEDATTEPVSSEQLAAEIERFLRDRRGR